VICPVCTSEYRSGYTRCKSCDVDLVDAAEIEVLKARTRSPRETLQGKETQAVATAGLAACREIEAAILDGGVPCYVAGENEEGEALSAGTMRYSVLVARDDLQSVGAILRGRFEALLAKEGTGTFQDTAIDLSQETVTCPACGHTGALVGGDCADCGLSLGVPASPDEEK
jgi:hypothetical protein